MMFSNDLAAAIAAQALNSIPAGLAITAVAWLGIKALSTKDSGFRFIVWFVALMAIVALPFIPSLPTPSQEASPLQAGLTLPASWASVTVIFWIAILGIMALRLVFGVCKLCKLKRESTPIEPSELPSEARNVLSEFEAERSIQVRTSIRVCVPTAIGFFKPVVLLPNWALELSEQDLTAVLLHEVAHLRRRDDWTNLAQRILGAVFFFHPAVWFVQRRLELEREMACDELVLSRTGNRHAYAACLVSLAERSVVRRSLAMAQSLIGQARSMAMRLSRILDHRQDSPQRSYGRAMTFACTAVVLCVALVPGDTKLIAFQDEGTHALNAVEVARVLPEQAAAVPAKIEANFHPEDSKPVRTISPRVTPRPISTTVQKRAAPKSREVVARASVPDNASLQIRYMLVVQTQLDADGEVRTNFCVWKLTLHGSGNQAIRAQVVMSSL